MQDPHTTYSSYILTYSYQLKKLKQQLFASSMLRLILFLLFAFLIYRFFGNTKLIIGVVIAAIIAFIF